MKKILKPAFGAVFVMGLIASCGGSSDGGSATGDGSNTFINSGLSGQLFFGGYGEGWLLDLPTGEYKRIPGIDWENETGTFYSGADFRAHPIAFDGSVVIAGIGDCIRESSQNFDCLARYSSAGELLGSNGRLPSSYHLVGTPKLSRDGEYLAFFFEIDTAGSIDDLLLVITDQSVTPISSSVVYTDSYTASSPSVTWLPDNRLAYTIEESVYVLGTALDVTTAQLLARFAEEEGEPRHLNASPDGSQLVFSLQTSSSTRTSSATPWVIDTEGESRQGLRQLVRVAEGQASNIKFPTWSPDGQSIFFIHGGVSAASSSDLGLQAGGYVIPAISDGLLLGGDNNDVIQIQSYFGMTSGHSSPELSTDLDIEEAPVAWIP